MKREEVIQSIKETTARLLPDGSKVVLFGSRARNEARQDSDWDILLLIPQEERTSLEDFDQFGYPLVDLGWSIKEEINPQLYSFKEWEARRSTIFYKNVMQDGIVL